MAQRLYLLRCWLCLLNCSAGRTVLNNPIIQAWFENDKPLLTKTYSSAGDIEDPDINNWKDQDSVWQRKKKIVESGKYFIGDQES